MNHYVTSAVIKELRERQHITQAELAEQLCVSPKTISKWETGRGLPDISLLEALAKSLHVSVPELLSGECITNANRASNLLRASIYVCPICGNVIHAVGKTMVSCCGITLPPLEAEAPDAAHDVTVETIEYEYVVHANHPMTKEHAITFMADVTGDRFELVKLYPEGSAESHFLSRGHGRLLWYCNHHGLFERRV